MDEPLSNDAFNDVLDDEDLGSGAPPSSHWLDVRSGNNQRMLHRHAAAASNFFLYSDARRLSPAQT